MTRQRSLQRSLIITIVVIIGFTVAAGIGAAAYYRATVSQAYQQAESASKQFEMASEIRTLYRSQMQEWKNLLLRGQSQDDYFDHLSSFYSRERAALLLALDMQDKLSGSGEVADLLQEFLVSHRAVGERLREAMSLYSVSEAEGRTMADRLVAEIEEEPMERLSALQAALLGDRQQLIDALNRQLASAQLYGTALGVLLMASAAVLLYLFMNRRFLRPIQQAKGIAERISRGHFDNAVVIERNDEIGLLLGSLERMQETLAQAWEAERNSKNELEHKVAERTSELMQEIERREQIDAELRQAQKMEAVGQLTAGVAHDFNNLLAVIVGNGELLQGRLDADDPRLKGIMTAARRAGELTQRLLAFSRKQILNPTPLNANTLIGQTVALVRRTLPANIEVRTGFDEQLWPCVADPVQLENALINLAVNARDAMPAGGELLIATSNTTIDPADAKNHIDVESGDYVMISVRDTGSGIDADDLGRVFEPFFTRKEVSKGSGLGLSMVYGFVKQSGGHVAIDSAPGRGTELRLYLPRATEDVTPAGIRDSGEAPPARGESVLVVEDDDELRELTVRMLRDLGYEVIDAANAAAALALLRQHGARDLLVTDVVLTGDRNGAQLAAECRRLYPDMRILFMSGYTESAVIEFGKLRADARLLNKPFRRSELARHARAALESPSAGDLRSRA